jgi:arabinogalactan endo-1,4-beta-galactosidase
LKRLLLLASLAAAGLVYSCSSATGTNSNTVVDQPVGDQGTGVPKGVDISEAYYAASKGVTYKDLQGTAKAPLQIFADHGYTWARVRLMVAIPASTTYNNGLVQDLAYVETAAKDIQAKGMKFLLDLHYSDYWADPSTQTYPASWPTYSTVADLATQVQTYTQTVVAALIAQGTTPDMVQIGNETNVGMLWSQGKITASTTAGFTAYATLEAAGAAGIKAAATAAGVTVPKLMVHIAKTATTAAAVVTWYTNLLNAGGDFDTIGLSYYPMWHGSQTLLGDTIKALRDNSSLATMPVWVVETASYWTTSTESGASNVTYNMTPAGQLAFLKATRATVTSAGGAGVFYWGATWVNTSKWLTASSVSGWTGVEKRALFNTDGVAQVGIDF